MKRKRILVSLLAAAVITTTVLTGCGGSGGSKEGGKGGKEVVLNLDSPAIRTLDSAKATDSASFNAITASFEGLLRANNEKPEAAGAEKWEVSKDQKTYTFHLRDQEWSDGKKVSAKDYEYAWKRILDPKTKSQYASFLLGIKNADKFYKGKATAEELGIKALDDKTFKVELEQPIPYFLEMTAFALLVPVRQDVVEAQGDKYGTDVTKMVFNGPFALKEWQKGAKLSTVKNDKYYDKDKIKIDKVNFLVIKELQTKYQMFANKELQVIPATGEYAEKLKKDGEAGKCDYVEDVAPSAFYMMYNQSGKNKLLTNSKIRLALSLAINREDYVNKVYKRGFVAYGLMPTKLLCGDKEYRQMVQEPLKELMGKKDPKALFVEGLKELGLDPDPAKHTLRFLPQDSGAFEKQSAEFFQNTWKQKIGVNFKIDTAASFADYLNKSLSGDFEVAMSGWGADYNDPYTFIEQFQKDNGNNHGKYNNPKYEEYIKQSIGVTDTAKRTEIFKKAERLLVNEDAGIAPLFYKDKRYATQKTVKGVQYPAFGGIYELKWASVEEK
ncbi:peptide ABC transporter substrate-binding protein [Clostridium sp. MB40-C1]|uniref:peptide ABC transporter substrate-binding protein n=1 Tax=Clostridium sp. MB40-C1 TaxID=3070996 RepID=UPI0027DF2DF0|nr:peptide ABC transporter substrate-binding protein [Clostridium sp. MB40-C1]WMJ81092.1 peptide ABC transporter substrate-binding protein [Clostridium sp. MB40-C1]